MPDDPPTFIVRETTFTSGFGEWTYGLNDDTAKRSWNLQASRELTPLDADAALAAMPVQKNDAFKPGDNRYCVKLTIKALAGELDGLYAEAEYARNVLAVNPLLRKDRISLEIASESQDWFIDADGKPLVNSAHDVFEKVPPRTTGGVKLVIEGNRAALPAVAMVALSKPHRINEAAFVVRGLTIPAGCAKLVGCSGSEQEENGTTFFLVRWDLALAETWDVTLEDRGLHFLDAGGEQTPFMDAGGPAQQGQPLDGSGNRATTAATLTFKPYTKTTFEFGWTETA